ncbi:MAG: MBL fold metallo-hydrolase [Actinomycetota bacterium]
METKVTILADNIAGPPVFKGEHGLSILVEVDGRSFLWDCGQSDVAVQNARLLGIDLREIEGIGISHGHLDHTWGLPAVLAASGPKTVHMHPDAYEPRYAKFGETRHFIGIQVRREVLQAGGLEFNAAPVEVMPGVTMTGEIPRVTDFEGPEPMLFIRKDAELVPDPFTDDQALVVDTPDGAVVITGCAHAGLVNTLKHVGETHGRVKAVIGGTHLGMGAPLEKAEKTMDYLEEIAPDRIVACHCTGTVVTSRMLDRFGDRFTPGQTGLVITL